ncbi:MAG TPA: PadR family transcriptional regulator [Gaiellaceae bacterium]|nr:PadR family transcriptional regulator [Gaiellaceae bacterium]
MSSTERELTTTSYAILGLLAIRPWSTYELARQMRRNLHYFWPRAESNLYAEPKRLVDGGFATSRQEPVGRRFRTLYSITEQGRSALVSWLSEPASESRLENETLVKVMFAPYGSKGHLLEHLRRFREEQEGRLDVLRPIFEEYFRDEDPFPARVHINTLCFRLIWDHTAAHAEWAERAIALVEGWSDVKEPENRPESVRLLREALAQR